MATNPGNMDAIFGHFSNADLRDIGLDTAIKIDVALEFIKELARDLEA